MKLIWLCNMMPSEVQKAMGGSDDGGLWVDHVLSDLCRLPDFRLRILCQGAGEGAGSLDDRTDYQIFSEGVPYHYPEHLETLFVNQLTAFQPDVIHIWGTEYGHTLAMVNAACSLGMEKRIVISIQGLCRWIAEHYCDGIPRDVCRSYTFRDLLRRDNLTAQQKKFVLRGAMEQQALEKVHHVIGRTTWDRACTSQINPALSYHFCNETMRDEFYSDQWRYGACEKHSIFVSSCDYPVKGFHYLLEVMEIVLKRYPDAQIQITGESVFQDSFSGRLREPTYDRFLHRLCRKNGLVEKVHFLGHLNAGQMKAAYLNANVFVLPSTIENSPNSLAEAMLLGVPSVAADVGGVSNLLHPGEGFLYPASEPRMLAHYIMEVFAMEDRAEAMGAAARSCAMRTHDPETNLKALLSAYQEVGAD